MITGYNTDVKHGSVLFHVQTEDKGLANPLVETLIYVGGVVVAGKRASYADLLEGGSGREAIVELMDRQHRGMIAAIQAGKLDERLAELGGRQAAKRPAGRPAPLAAPGAGEPAAPATAAGDLVIEMHSEGPLVLGGHAALVLRTTSRRTGRPVSESRVAVRLISTVAHPIELAAGRTDASGTIRLAVAIPALAGGSAALIVSASSPLGAAEIQHLL